jgi:predicted transcriptional regulator
MKKHQIQILLKLIPISQHLYTYIVSNEKDGKIMLYPAMLKEELDFKGSTIYKGIAELERIGLIEKTSKYKYKFNDLKEIE